MNQIAQTSSMLFDQAIPRRYNQYTQRISGNLYVQSSCLLLPCTFFHHCCGLQEPVLALLSNVEVCSSWEIGGSLECGNNKFGRHSKSKSFSFQVWLRWPLLHPYLWSSRQRRRTNKAWLSKAWLGLSRIYGKILLLDLEPASYVQTNQDFRPALNIKMLAFWWRIPTIFRNKLAVKFRYNPGLRYNQALRSGWALNPVTGGWSGVLCIMYALYCVHDFTFRDADELNKIIP